MQYTPPLISDYSFNLVSSELCYKKFGELGISASNNCATGVSWNSSTNLINLTITSGQEFASFYHYDFSSYFPTIELLGDNIEVTLAELEDISLEQDSLFNGSNVKVNVHAEWGGVIKTDSATAYPASEYVVSAESFGVEEVNTGEEVFIELNVLSNLSCSFCLPLYETYNAEIIKGGEYGSLIDPVSGESVQSLTGIEQYTFGPGQPCGVADLDYIADGVSADVDDSVIIRISTSDPQIQPTDKLFLIKPSPVYVTITPDTLAPGDTASIIIKKRNPDGTIEDFPDDQFLEVGMLTGCLSGIILDCYDDTCYQDTYFSDVLPTDSVYFVADSSADSGTVKIRVGIVDDGGGISAGIAAPTNRTGLKKIGKEKHKLSVKKNRSVEEKAVFIKDVKSRINNSALLVSEKQKMIEKLNTIASPKAQSSECYIGDYIGVTPANKNVIIKKEEEQHTIMLGETKYYTVKKKVENGAVTEIKIEEIPVDYGDEPAFPESAGEGWEWVKQNNVWPDVPVDIVEGDKLGVYWEKEKPVWKFNYYIDAKNVERFTKEKVGILPQGIIRLIGRYWEEEKSYKVKLKAQIDNGLEPSIIIEVVKPGKLGTSYQTAKDVSINDLNIDSICIEKGGKLGIPPQFIKGHMRRETSSYHPFNPTYLYEPWTTQFNDFINKPELLNTSILWQMMQLLLIPQL